VAECSEDFQARLNAADAMISEGQFEQALVLLETLDMEDPDHPDVILLTADAFFEMGDLETALDHYDHAVELDPEWSEAHSDRANCLVEIGKVDEAIQDVETALRLSVKNAQAHHVRAMLLELEGKTRLAENAYHTAAKLAPDVFFMPYRVSRRVFDAAVREAIKRLPVKFRKRLGSVEIFVKDLPSIEDHPDAPRAPLLLGAFDGRSITEQADSAPCTETPPRIYLYQKNIERVCATRQDLVREIEITFLHEVGHYFGMEEDDLDRVDLK